MIINNELFNLRESRDEIDFNSMSDDIKRIYYLIYDYYNLMFYNFILNNTKIREIDEKLNNSNLKFREIEDNSKDFYQLLSNQLKFFYIRNNLYLYRLNKEENDFIRNRILNNNFNYDKEMEEFIIKTFKKVIYEPTEENNIINVNYGPHELNFYAPNNSLVIGFRNNYYDNGFKDEEWYENYKKQKVLVKQVTEELVKNITYSLDCNCYLFEYNEFSVKKNNNVNLSK